MRPAGTRALIALLLTLATWQTRSLLATAGLDPSWRVALHLTWTRGIDFGPDFTWTYGPLGFLSFPIAVSGGTLVAAFLFVFATQALLAYMLVREGTAVYGWPLAILLAYVVLCLPVPPADFLPLTAFLLAAWELRSPSRWFPVAGGLVAALALLTKTNTGAAAVAIVLVAATARGRRRAGETLGVAVAAFLLGWLLTGNSLLDLPDWLRLSAGLVSGYSSAMQYEQHGLGRDYVLAAVVLALIVLVAVRRRSVPLWLVTAGFAFAFFKEGFVRHDDAHASAFFSAAAVAFVALAGRDVWRVVAAGGFVLAAVAASLGGGTDFAPTASAGRALGQLHDVASSSKRHALVEDSTQSQQRSYEVPPRLLALLHGHTVHVDPFETAAVAAYGLRWSPLPIVQSYSAYTPSLDRANARRLASEDAPERILREPLTKTVNLRGRDLEAPAQFRAMLCDYVELGASAQWQVLAHRPRCDQPQPLATIDAPAGVRVTVPEAPADRMVIVRVQLHDSIFDALRGFVYKPHVPVVSLSGGPFTRIPAGVAADGIVLHVPGAIAFDPRFGGAIDWRTIAAGGLAGRVQFKFETVRVHGEAPQPHGARAARPLPHWALGTDGIRAPDGKLLPLDEGGGFVDWAWEQRGLLVLRGWAADAAAGRPARTVLVFADGRLVFAGPPNSARPDVAQALGKPRLASAGYSILLPLGEVRAKGARADVRIFSIVGRRALEVEYPFSYGWRRR